MRCINENKDRIVEGRLRSKELNDYLENLKTVKRIWVAEDATAIIRKVCYDPITNQLIGIVLPIDEKNGCPLTLQFSATDENTIKQHMKKSTSKFVYLVLAQPLDEKIPPFVLQMFGSNSEFKSIAVIKRWEFTRLELEK